MFVLYIFVFLGFLFDGVVEACFHINVVADSMFFVSCFGFSALVLTVRKMELFDAMILSLLAGMFYDFFYTDSFLLYTTIFALSCLLVKSWTKHLGDSLIESVVICVSAIFAMQLLVFVFLKLIGQTNMSFYSWIINRMFLTIVVNAILVIILHFFTKLRDAYIMKRDLRVRKDERIFLYKAKR